MHYMMIYRNYSGNEGHQIFISLKNAREESAKLKALGDFEVKLFKIKEIKI